MRLLPEHGWTYRDVRALSLREHELLIWMMEIEARAAAFRGK